MIYDKKRDYSRMNPVDEDYVESVLVLMKQRHEEKLPQICHFTEHELWCDVLKSIATGKVKKPEKLAESVLRTLNIPFDRHYGKPQPA